MALGDDPEHEKRREELKAELVRKERRSGVIPYIDPLDVRYRRIAIPKPVAQAVMFWPDGRLRLDDRA